MSLCEPFASFMLSWQKMSCGSCFPTKTWEKTAYVSSAPWLPSLASEANVCVTVSRASEGHSDAQSLRLQTQKPFRVMKESRRLWVEAFDNLTKSKQSKDSPAYQIHMYYVTVTHYITIVSWSTCNDEWASAAPCSCTCVPQPQPQHLVLPAWAFQIALPQTQASIWLGLVWYSVHLAPWLSRTPVPLTKCFVENPSIISLHYIYICTIYIYAGVLVL